MSVRLSALQSLGADYVSGVPCSYLKAFFKGCEALPSQDYLPAVREDHAISACAGAWLAGRRPVAAMQNSGLGYCLEVLTSLHLLYNIPLMMLVSDRGQDNDYEEHRILGQHARQLLDIFEIPWKLAGDEEEDAAWLINTTEAGQKPAVLLVPQECDS